MSGHVLSRRGFVAVSGGAGAGLVLGFSLLGCDRRAEALGALGPGTLNAWIRIGTDDTVSFLLSESEMGQGTHTALAMLLAEELEVPWDPAFRDDLAEDVQYHFSPAQPDGAIEELASRAK